MINISLISRHGTSARKMAFSSPLSDYLTTHRPVNNYNKLKILQVGSDLLRRKWQVTILTFKIYVAAWPSSDTQHWIMSTIRTVRTPCHVQLYHWDWWLGLELDVEIYFSLFADSVLRKHWLAVFMFNGISTMGHRESGGECLHQLLVTPLKEIT